MKTNTYTKLSTILIASTALAFAGCSIEQTEEGEMPDIDVSGDAGELPEYEVVKTDEGEAPDVDVDVEEGNLPEYDVDGPDVDVGWEEKVVKVPDVDVDMPDDNEADEETNDESDRDLAKQN